MSESLRVPEIYGTSSAKEQFGQGALVVRLEDYDLLQARVKELEAQLQSPLQRDGMPTLYISGSGFACTHRLSETDLPVLLRNADDGMRLLKLMKYLVERERTAERLEGWCDLMVDEFKRIAVCHGVSGEIKGLCERAINNTKQHVSVISQRDRLETANLGLTKTLAEMEAENAELRAHVDSLRQSLLGYLPPSILEADDEGEA